MCWAEDESYWAEVAALRGPKTWALGAEPPMAAFAEGPKTVLAGPEMAALCRPKPGALHPWLAFAAG